MKKIRAEKKQLEMSALSSQQRAAKLEQVNCYFIFAKIQGNENLFLIFTQSCFAILISSQGGSSYTQSKGARGRVEQKGGTLEHYS